MKENVTIDKKYNTLIVLVSIVIPVVVAILFNVKSLKNVLSGTLK